MLANVPKMLKLKREKSFFMEYDTKHPNNNSVTDDLKPQVFEEKGNIPEKTQKGSFFWFCCCPCSFQAYEKEKEIFFQILYKVLY